MPSTTRKSRFPGLLGFESLHSGSLIGSSSFQPQAAIGLHWRLFDFGRVDAEVAQAKGANAQALAEYRQAMLKATEDVENAIVTLTELEAQRLDVNQEVEAHQVARTAAEGRLQGWSHQPGGSARRRSPAAHLTGSTGATARQRRQGSGVDVQSIGRGLARKNGGSGFIREGVSTISIIDTDRPHSRINSLPPNLRPPQGEA